ncbi:MAG: protease inhibitor I42 family protein [Clostridiales bacterium]|nr:protease inhibitor I42 family protein [Clostridiales bacterium]
MKKLITLILSLIMILVFTACGDMGADDSDYNDSVETLTVELDANPTTGYTWGYNKSSEGIIKITENYVKGRDDEEVVGACGKSVFTITGIKEGDVTVIFSYGPQWEGWTKDAEVKTYELHVDSDLAISVVSKSEVENVD